MIASLNYQFESLSAENQKRVMALHDPDTSGDIDQKVMRIFKINCIEGWSSQKWSKNLQKERKTIFLCSKPCGRRCTLPPIPRMNHSCSPNAVWSWKKGNTKRKEIRALRKSVSKDLNRLNSLKFLRISEGDEICSNYIDDVETNYNTSKARQVRKKILIL